MVDFPEKCINSKLNKDLINAHINETSCKKKAAIIDFKNGGGFTCNVDKEFISLNDILTYTIILKNTGDISASNVVFRLKFKEYGDIIPGTIFVNGIIQGVSDPTLKNGIILGNLQCGKASIIKYNVKVNKVPIDNKIKSAGYVTFDYIDTLGNNCTGYGESNLSISTLNLALIRCDNITFTPTINNSDIDINEIITYKVNFSNVGNSPANNIILKNTVSEGCIFIYDSITINGFSVLGIINNNVIEIPVGVLNPNENSEVCFSVRINKIPRDNVLKNKTEVFYSYINNPESEACTGNIKFNEVIIPISTVNFNDKNIKLTADKQFMDKDDELLYTLVLRNSGSVTANKVFIQEIVPDNTDIIVNSISINGKLDSKNYCNNNLFIGEVGKNQTITVSYKVKVKKIVNCIMNKCKINYTYQNENGKLTNKIINSKDIITKINTAYINCKDNGFLKLADKAYVKLGEMINYTLRLRNTGNVAAKNLFIKDPLSPGMNFINDSIYINGINKKHSNIVLGLLIENLDVNETLVISYSTIIEALPVNNILVSNSTLQYEYFIDPCKSKIQKTIKSNCCQVIINDINFSGKNLTTSVDKTFVSIDDEITYKVNIVNTGNLSAKNTLLKNHCPDGTLVVPNSILIDGVPMESVDFLSGIHLGNIKPNIPMEISYKLKVYKVPIDKIILNNMKLIYTEQINPNTLPTRSIISRKFPEVQVNFVNLTCSRKCNTNFAVVGDIVTYELKLSNLGSLDINNIFIRDVLSPSLEYVENSIYADKRLKGENIINGINIGDILSGQEKVIRFSAKVLNCPNEGEIVTQSICSYKYTSNPNELPSSKTLESEKNILNIKNVCISIGKYCSAEEANPNDLIKFKIIIENKGNIDVTGFIFKENLPNELEFISSSFLINGIKINSINIKSGIRLGVMKSGQKVEILFNALVKYTEHGCVTLCESHGEYSYKLNDNSEIKKGNCSKVSNKIRILNSVKKSLTLEGICELADANSVIESVNNIRANVEILDSYVRKNTNSFLNNECEKSYKLIINGVLKQLIDFDSRAPVGISSNTSEFTKKFSSFLILPGDYNVTKNINVTANIQDIFFDKINHKNISTSVLVTFTANVL